MDGTSVCLYKYLDFCSSFVVLSCYQCHGNCKDLATFLNYAVANSIYPTAAAFDPYIISSTSLTDISVQHKVKMRIAGARPNFSSPSNRNAHVYQSVCSLTISRSTLIRLDRRKKIGREVDYLPCLCQLMQSNR